MVSCILSHKRQWKQLVEKWVTIINSYIFCLGCQGQWGCNNHQLTMKWLTASCSARQSTREKSVPPTDSPSLRRSSIHRNMQHLKATLADTFVDCCRDDVCNHVICPLKFTWFLEFFFAVYLKDFLLDTSYFVHTETFHYLFLIGNKKHYQTQSSFFARAHSQPQSIRRSKMTQVLPDVNLRHLPWWQSWAEECLKEGLKATVNYFPSYPAVPVLGSFHPASC